jgi:uncharacterized membrane protein YeaQ/YmgE (transglycosylase-associated protein family)
MCEAGPHAAAEEAHMEPFGLLAILVIGAVAGWLAGQIVKGYGFGLVGNIVIGILGAFLAGLILPRIGLGMGGGMLAAILHATIGAVILLFLLRLVKQG